MKQLTAEQLDVLRRLPLDGKPNRIRLALAIVEAKQSDLVEVTGLPQPYVSDVMRGRFDTITIDKARVFSEAFGCAIEDLFPSQVAA